MTAPRSRKRSCTRCAKRERRCRARATARGLTSRRGEANSPVLAMRAPSMVDDPAMNAWFSSLERFAASPAGAG